MLVNLVVLDHLHQHLQADVPLQKWAISASRARRSASMSLPAQRRTAQIAVMA
jgi:hypothetical protein